MPRPGDIAYCSKGRLGLITGQQASMFEPYTLIWVGVHLRDYPDAMEKMQVEVGTPWGSKDPKVIGHIDTALDLFMQWLQGFAEASSLKTEVTQCD